MDNGNRELDLDSQNLNLEEWGYQPNHDSRSIGNAAIFSPEAPTGSPETLPLPDNDIPRHMSTHKEIEIVDVNPPSSPTIASPEVESTIAHLQDAIKAHHGEINVHTATAIDTAVNSINDPSEITAVRNALLATTNGEGKQ